MASFTRAAEPKISRVSVARAFPHLKIALDDSVGPLSFLNYIDRARAEAVSRQFRQETRSPLLWGAFADLGDARAVDDTYFVRAFVRKTPRMALLKRIDFAAPRDLTVVTFNIIGACCPLLSSLKVTGLPDEDSLLAIADGCPAMEELVLSDSEGTLTDAALVYAIERFPKLTIFRVCPGDPDSENFDLTDTTVLALATHCRSLSVFESWHAALSDNSIIALAKNCPLLTVLDIQSCDDYADLGITDASLFAIAERCPALTELNISFLPGLSNAGVVTIATRCKHLKRFEMYEMGDDPTPQFSEETIRIIRKTCPFVQT